MANWCQNIVYMTAPDEHDAVAFISSAANEELNEVFRVEERYAPTLGGAGTNYVKREGNYIEIASHSRNDPPIELYRAMEAQGWKVNATYWDPDNLFWGTYRAGSDDRNEYEYDKDKDEIAQLPAEVITQFRPSIRTLAHGSTVMTLYS